jgi:hypothetical protein
MSRIVYDFFTNVFEPFVLINLEELWIKEIQNVKSIYHAFQTQ